MEKPRTVEEFEVFKAELRGVPIEQIKACLDLEIEFTLEDMCTRGENILSIVRFTSLAMAKSGIEPPKEPTTPNWLATARDQFKFFVGERLWRKQMFNSIYFTGSAKEIRDLGRLTSSCIEPAGDYDGHSFAAGLVLGQVALNLRSD